VISGARHVASFLEGRLDRWMRKIKRMMARSRGIFMQEAKGGHVGGVYKHKVLGDIE